MPKLSENPVVAVIVIDGRTALIRKQDLTERAATTHARREAALIVENGQITKSRSGMTTEQVIKQGSGRPAKVRGFVAHYEGENFDANELNALLANAFKQT